MGDRLSSGLVSITAVGAGDGVVLGVAAANPTAWTLSTGKRAIIKKIAWRNRAGANGNLLIGFGDRTVAGSIFRQVFPSILMLNGVDGEIGEEALPVMGNSREGFANDGTVTTGTTGNIIVETDIAGVGAAPGNVQVIIELEEV